MQPLRHEFCDSAKRKKLTILIKATVPEPKLDAGVDF